MFLKDEGFHLFYPRRDNRPLTSMVAISLILLATHYFSSNVLYRSTKIGLENEIGTVDAGMSMAFADKYERACKKAVLVPFTQEDNLVDMYAKSQRNKAREDFSQLYCPYKLANNASPIIRNNYFLL